jgi:hypothetical protein
VDVLRSPKYHDLQGLNFFYYDETENLIRTSERIAAASEHKIRAALATAVPPSSSPTSASRLSAPIFSNTGLIGTPSFRRSKSILHSRNLGTMRKAKQEKRTAHQAEPDDDMILRLLRMRTEPDANTYLKRRAIQKRNLAVLKEREAIIRQSMQVGTTPSPGPVNGTGRMSGGGVIGRNRLM